MELKPESEAERLPHPSFDVTIAADTSKSESEPLATSVTEEAKPKSSPISQQLRVPGNEKSKFGIVH